MLTSKIASPGVVINEMSAFPADVTPVASALPPFLGSAQDTAAPDAPVLVPSAAASNEDSIVSSEEVDERNDSPPAK